MFKRLTTWMAGFRPGTTEYHQRQVNNLIRETDRQIARRIGAIPDDDDPMQHIIGDASLPPDFFRKDGE